MNRWIQFLIKCSKIYGAQPKLVDKVIESDMPSEVFDNFYSEDELERIEQLKDAKVKMLDEIEELDAKISGLTRELTEKENNIADLENIFLAEERYDAPDWLDTSKSAFTPRKQVAKKSGTLRMIPMRMEDYFNYSDLMTEIIEAKGWKNLPTDEKLQEIWNFVCSNIDYAYDLAEDWRFAETEYRYGRADCEGCATTMYGLARAAGIPPTKVFLATGYFYRGGNKYGHAFIIAKPNDKWMVYETTLSQADDSPKQLAGSNYSVEWGVGNHAWTGQVKPSHNKGSGQKVQV